ncbi:phage integrase family protein [Bifidobacterium saguini DSM 23967]|uniref:Phage integrase family protein n=2 Tax=Bifidobacterium saguini TaxID=762210 RepID=A0A087DAD1_9BIFI|nr:site-specific integrase [Bifidobacterium saguini]KFI92481.1 phage integrase family protein [Bifidobacterium saguini DSM 23967]QTB90795.1 site-specific integrase [Bifidobacterium saguini]QTB90857.1 site-specific integrase [Bifidobacterium saguini]
MATIVKYQTSNGETRYMVRYRKPDGSQTKQRGFKRKIDATNWAAEHVTTAKAKGIYIDPQAGKITVGELADAWLAKKKLGTKPSYYDDLEDSWNKWVKPEWGSIPVAAVTREKAQQWAAKISQGTKGVGENGHEIWVEKPKSASVVLRAHGILAGILDDAKADRRIPDNPVRGIELPRKARSKHTYLTVEQLYALAAACTTLQRSILVLTLGLTGLRWGECVGLTVADIDFTAHRIDVNKSATQVRRRMIIGTPKTWEMRRIMYPDALEPLLRQLCEGKRPENLLFPDPTTKDGYTHQPHSPKSDDRSWYAKACIRAEVPRLTVHDLRHTAASLMVKSGANVKAVQHQLGHKSAAMTLDVYADLFADDLDELSERMGELLLREGVPKMCPNDVSEAA